MVDKVIEFLESANKLKWVERRGWVARVNVKQPESVADHCYLTAIICMVIADLKGLNTNKVVKMALLHDLAESIIGDYMPEEISSERKHEEESKAIKTILNKLPPRLSSNYTKIWQEYKKQSSKEAALVHQIDKLEMAFQARGYMQKGYDPDLLRQFFDSAGMHVKDKTLLKMLNSLKHSKS
ncbi:MAG: HD domain-containing protein [Nitrososphaerales archaeon]